MRLSLRRRCSVSFVVGVAAVGLVAGGLVVGGVAGPAEAFKPTTHMTVAQQALDSIKGSGGSDPYYAEIAGQRLDLDPEVVAAVKDFPGVYMAGSIGPDAYPEIVFGQSIIHPSDSMKWLQELWDSAHALPAGDAAASTKRAQALAFTVGFSVHAAGDFWGHGFMNKYSGGVFPSLAEIGKDPATLAIAAKHVILEGYVDQFRPGLKFKGDSKNVEGGTNYDSPIKRYIDRGVNTGDRTAEVPLAWLQSVFIDSALGKKVIETKSDQLLQMIIDCKDGSSDCPIPTNENETSPTPHRDKMMAMARGIFQNYNSLGTLIVNKVLYAPAPEFNPSTKSGSPADRFAKQANSYLLDKWCRMVTSEGVCGGMDLVSSVSDWLASVSDWLASAADWLVGPIKLLIEEAMTDVMNAAIVEGVNLARSSSDGIQNAQQRAYAQASVAWVIKVLDSDKDGTITMQDLKQATPNLPAVIVNGKCPALDGQLVACFDAAAINSALGVTDPTSNKNQNFSADKFAAYGNTVNTILLSMATDDSRNVFYKKLGLKGDAAQIFSAGARGSNSPALGWLGTYDGTSPDLGMSAYKWPMWTNCDAQENVFLYLFKEPYPGYFNSSEDCLRYRSPGNVVPGTGCPIGPSRQPWPWCRRG